MLGVSGTKQDVTVSGTVQYKDTNVKMKQQHFHTIFHSPNATTQTNIQGDIVAQSSI